MHFRTRSCVRVAFASLCVTGFGLVTSDDTERIIRLYEPMQRHPELFDQRVGWQDSWFDPDFQQAMVELKSGVTLVQHGAVSRAAIA
jgi:hypothetical protein